MSRNSADLRVANPERHVLGEGPFWDPVRERLLWVDIRRCLVLAGVLRPDGEIRILERVAFRHTVGAVAAAENGDWIVAGRDELLVRRHSGEVASLVRILPRNADRRLNDGKPDPAGRYLVGSLSLGDESTGECLVAVDQHRTVRTIDSDLTLSNGLAWTRDGSSLYTIDTLRRLVYQRSYDPETGESGPRRVFLTVSDGFPDGMCLDAEEHLWIAMWGLGEVRRYAPDGTLVSTVSVPAPHVSSVAFAGPALDTLVITTATQDLTDDQLQTFPASGRIFTVRPGVRGLPQPLWGGLDRLEINHGMRTS